MATTVIQAFNEFLKNTINLDKDETKTARASRDWLVGQIQTFANQDDDFPNVYSDKNIFYGSFSKNTKKRPLDDIDIMICLNANGCTYLEYSDRIELTVSETKNAFHNYVNANSRILNSRKLINALVGNLMEVSNYKKAEIKRNMEAATLSLQSYDWVFDIVPCFFTQPDIFGKTFYIIPDGNGNWKKTDPRKDIERVQSVNKLHNGNILSVIRTAKYWNNRPTMPSISTYLFENMLLDYFASKPTVATEFVDIEIVDVFLDLQQRVYWTVNDPKNIQGDLNKLTLEEKKKISDRAYSDYVNAFEARKFEREGNQKASINKWKEIFGDAFPNYSE